MTRRTGLYTAVWIWLEVKVKLIVDQRNSNRTLWPKTPSLVWFFWSFQKINKSESNAKRAFLHFLWFWPADCHKMEQYTRVECPTPIMLLRLYTRNIFRIETQKDQLKTLFVTQTLACCLTWFHHFLMESFYRWFLSVFFSWGCFIYILDSSNSSSLAFWSSKLASSSRSNWTGKLNR